MLIINAQFPFSPKSPRQICWIQRAHWCAERLEENALVWHMCSGHHVLQRGRFWKPNFILRGCFIRAFCFVFRKIKVRVPRRVELRYKEVKFSFFSGFFRLKSLLRGHFPVNNEAQESLYCCVHTREQTQNRLWKVGIQGLLGHMAAPQGEEDFHKERIKSFCRRCGNPFDQNSNDGHNPQPAAKFAKEILEIDNLDIASDNSFIHSSIHHFCAVAVLRKYKGLKKVRTKIIQSFPVIKVNIAFLKHIMNIL